MSIEILIPIPDVTRINQYWCVYEHHKPPHIILVNYCKYVDIFKMLEGRNIAEWRRIAENNEPLLIRIVHMTLDIQEAARVMQQRLNVMPQKPHCNLHSAAATPRRRARIKCSNGMEFPSQVEAARYLGVKQSNISTHLKDGVPTMVKGHTFEYME